MRGWRIVSRVTTKDDGDEEGQGQIAVLDQRPNDLQEAIQRAFRLLQNLRLYIFHGQSLKEGFRHEHDVAGIELLIFLHTLHDFRDVQSQTCVLAVDAPGDRNLGLGGVG